MLPNLGQSDHVMAGEERTAAEVMGVGGQYSRLTGLIYIFNLIVGTGALTLPAAFHHAGWSEQERTRFW